MGSRCCNASSVSLNAAKSRNLGGATLRTCSVTLKTRECRITASRRLFVSALALIRGSGWALRRDSATDFPRRSRISVEVPHRSLVRRLERKYFAGSQTWASPQDVPAAAAFEFGDVDDDPHTSLWDDGPAKESWREALLSILLARSSLGALDVTTLWQDQLAQCGSRIHETPGDTRFKCDLSLHFELLGETYASDYIEMALAAARRNDFCSFTEPQVVEVLEDAFYDKLFEWADLDEGSLKKNL